MNENYGTEMLKSLETNNMAIVELNKTNQFLIKGLVISFLAFCVTACVISGFYFLGQGYANQSQTITDGKIEQTIMKGE